MTLHSVQADTQLPYTTAYDYCPMHRYGQIFQNGVLRIEILKFKFQFNWSNCLLYANQLCPLQFPLLYKLNGSQLAKMKKNIPYMPLL